MKQEELKKWLKQEAVPSDLINYFMGEEVGDDFDKNALTEKFNNTKTEVIKAKLKKDGFGEEELKKEREQIAGALFKPVLKSVSATTGIPKEDLADLSVSQLIDKLNAYHVEHSNADSDEKVKKALAELSKYKTQTVEWQDKYEDLQTSVETTIAEKLKAKEQEVNQFKTQRLFDEMLFNKNNIEFDERGPSFYKDLILLNAKRHGYEFYTDENEKLAIKAADGTEPLSLDEKTIYKEPIEYVRDLANREKYVKKSRGGSGTSVLGRINADTSVEGGKDIDVSGLDKMAASLGIK